LVASTDQKLKRRKLDALRRGVHRIGADEALGVATHVVGIGKAGAAAIVELLRALEPGSPLLSVLAIDIGDGDLVDLRSVAASMPDRASVETFSIDVPSGMQLLDTLSRYPEFLKLEYPHYRWGANHQPWLSPPGALAEPSGHQRRAVAKALYGHSYYADARPMQAALRRFATAVEAASGQSVVGIVFGLAGGTGSGIAVDLARHLSSRLFGRRILVAGIGIAPCDGDAPEHSGSRLFAVLNELDCLNDESKNEGVVKSCGELFRNPFTAGFIVVPQQAVWSGARDLAATHRRIDREIATFLAARGGASLWETLRLLNWVAAPSTQHSAARTPWGSKWIHMLGFADAVDGPVRLDESLPGRLGLLASYRPEFIEIRVPAMPEADRNGIGGKMEQAFHPDVAPQIIEGGRDGSIQFILPSIGKTDLAGFATARAAYDRASARERLLDHSMLLDQGLLLSEPSSRLEGMAGASLAGNESWIAVPLQSLRGDGAGRRSAALDAAEAFHAA
jgi:hypothetical protein